MLSRLREIYERAQEKLASELAFEADGITYVRRFEPAERLILLGGGNVSQALCTYAAELGFDVTVVDDRPDFANRVCFPDASEIICDGFAKAISELAITERDYIAVLTRGHRYDAECLRTVLSGRFPRYLGMMGSKRRVAELFKMLIKEGFPNEKTDMIHAPIGISIDALTVREIAVSILAELIKEKRKTTERHSGSPMLTECGTDMTILGALTDSRAKALMIVVATEGSTPVKSGAMMTIDSDLRTVGTIGGGCSEHIVLTEARKLIGTGKCKTVDVNMNADISEEEGMVCGGHMKIFVTDVYNYKS